ncbi:hypothetical protein [Sorangium sp. So ce426]|uniref:hypothetical protein n=1 Tax=Sorangium sp. So ce426 TaxID=3133312 RepID=UPI003F5B5FCE
MRLVLDRALFAPQSGREAGELLRLFTAAIDDVAPHAVQTDPPYVLGADNQEIDAWLAGRHAEEAGALQAVLAQGNVLASGARGAASVDPAPLPSWRLAGGFDVRVERRAASDWGALQLTLADAIDLLREPVHLLLENEFNDLAFVCHLAGPTLGPVLRRLHAASGRLHVHGGGGGQAKTWLEALIEPPLTAAKWRRALRAWVLFDQDSGDPDARDPSRTAVDMMTLCERVHAAFPAGLTWSCLRRREIESYVPDAGLHAEATATHGAMVQQIVDWRRDPALAPLAWAFDLKLGLRGDLRSSLPQATREAVKRKTLALDATMLKVPFDALGPAEVAALDSGLGKSRLNDALKADPPSGWTSDIPAEYDRGPAHQAPRLALIQSLFDRI